jgi:hypothetical protein
LTGVDDSQQAMLISSPLSPPPARPVEAIHAGDPVRLTERYESLPSGAVGRVVGFYRLLDPPQALVAFAQGACSVAESSLELIAS